MLGTSTTPYDLKFRLLDIPVRIHPMFWLISAILGWHDQNMELVVLWIACMFVSILVHEFGHALAARHFGQSPWILLYGLGGLCYSERQGTKGQRLAVILSGPGAGFVLFLIVLVVWSLLYGITPLQHFVLVSHIVGLGAGPVAAAFALLGGTPEGLDFNGLIERFGPLDGGNLAYVAYHNLVWINLLWTLVNLLPIWPLDGGQACQTILSVVDRKNGVRRSHVIALITAGILAVIVGVRTSDLFLTFFFGMFAFMNYQILQSMHNARAMGIDDGDDWWRR
jgi:Zn-dependent protease